MALDGNEVVAVKYALANLPTASTLKIKPAQAKATLLGVDDLNSMQCYLMVLLLLLFLRIYYQHSYQH